MTAFPSPVRIPVRQRLDLVLSNVPRRQRGVESSNAPPSCFFGSESGEIPLLPHVRVRVGALKWGDLHSLRPLPLLQKASLEREVRTPMGVVYVFVRTRICGEGEV